MAVYHLHATPIGRSAGRSAVAAAAYRSGSRLSDARTGLTHDYTAKGGVGLTMIIMPPSAGDWRPSRDELWNAAEKANGRSDAVIAREFEVSLPYELSPQKRQALALDIARYAAEKFGVAVDLAIHEPHRGRDERNHHVHVMLTAKRVRGDGFGTKALELDPISAKRNGEQNGVATLREVWAAMGTAALHEAGFTVEAERFQHGHKTLAEQRAFALARGDVAFAEGIDRDATEHLGPTAAAMERRGAHTERGDDNRAALAQAEDRAALKAEACAIAAEIIDIEAERAKRAADRDVVAAVRTFDPARILDSITANRSTFTRNDLNYALSKEITDAKDRAVMNDAILSRPEVVALREKADGPVTRYTTRAVLAAERDVLANTAAMTGDSRHGLTTRQQANALDRFGQLDTEQRAAFAHATGPAGFAVIAGEAGTGKSRVINAVREAYEDAGRRVVGMSWTNSVVEDMRRDGFGNASTVASELFRLERGSTHWDARTVIVVDEAAMLSTKHLAAVTDKAEAAGAKLILVGDDKQLASIERGGLFGALKDEHGAAELHSVRRVTDADQREAFNLMHRGEFRPALEIFEQRGAIRWTETQDTARAELVGRYRTDLDASPDRTRFAFAYTNAEVADLNRDIRAMQRERGALGPDQRLETKHGLADFATGDRVQFTANGLSKAEKAAGFVNGSVGTVREIDGQRMTVELDGLTNGKARVVSFSVGVSGAAGEFDAFRHGYAGTIYKGQGKTLDQTYLLHSKHWREASSYVALSRHRDEVAVFVAKDTANDLGQLARQMARVDDRRAASQFHCDPLKDQRPADPGRGFEQAAREAAARSQAGKSPEVQPSAREAAVITLTAQQRAASQRKAAIIGRISDPAKQAAALYRLHKKDAADRTTGWRREEAPSPVSKISSADQAYDRLRDKLAKTAADIERREAERPAADAGRLRDRGRTR